MKYLTIASLAFLVAQQLRLFAKHPSGKSSKHWVHGPTA